jgi:hypothetical protein
MARTASVGASAGRSAPMPRKGATTVHVPLKLRRIGGRKRVVMADGLAPPTTSIQPESALLRAIIKAHHWQSMLNDGRYSSIAELAAAHKISHTYACRIMSLNALSPRIVEAILEGRQGPEVTMAAASRPFSAVWSEQTFDNTAS